MSIVQTSDIAFVLSGGGSNKIPSMSLGGAPSSTPVAGTVNSLFGDVVESDAVDGLVDYRCVYILNKSSTGTLYSASVHVQSQVAGGSQIELGLARFSEIQVVRVFGTPTSGTLSLRLGSLGFSGVWGGSPEAFLSSLLSSLSSVGMGDVSVSYTSGSPHVFTFYFLESYGNTALPLIEVAVNGLSPAASVSISRQRPGAPINAVAPLLATPTVSPFEVEFSQTSPISKMVVGNLGPGDSIPLWIRRTTPAGTGFKENDSVTIRVSGDPFGSQKSSSSSSNHCASFVAYELLCPIELYESMGIPLSSFCRPVVSDYENGCPKEYGCGAYVGGECVDIYGLSSSSISSSGSGLVWLAHPSTSEWIGPVGANYSEFSYEYKYLSNLFTGQTAFQYRDDGGVWQDFTPSQVTFASSPGGVPTIGDPGPFWANFSGTFRVNNFVRTRRYRVKARVGGVDYYSNSAYALCAWRECSQTWPVPYPDIAPYADCGLFPQPGFNQNFDCDICKCVKTPISSSSSSLFSFNWITQPGSTGMGPSRVVAFNQNGATFFYEFDIGNQYVNPTTSLQFSDDGVDYNYVPSNLYTATVASTWNTNKTSFSGTFKLQSLSWTYVPGGGTATAGGPLVQSRRYRIRVQATGGAGVGASLSVPVFIFTSEDAFAVCAASECSQYWPMGYAGPVYSAECGMFPEPGYKYDMDCGYCTCVKTPV